VDGIKKGKLQVHVELGPENWRFGFVANTPDVPQEFRLKDAEFPVRLEQPPAANNTFSYILKR
jgi:hypothetical protein